jgi:hypothetical protein
MSGKPDAKCEPHEDAAQSGTEAADRIDAQDPGSRFRPLETKTGRTLMASVPWRSCRKPARTGRFSIEGVAGAAEHVSEPVSYTHLTLPTSP